MIMNPQTVIGSDETATHVFKRHIMSVLPIVAALLILPLIAFASSLALTLYGPELGVNDTAAVTQFGLVMLSVLALLLAYGVVVIYRDNAVIITDKNLYEVTRHGLFSRTVVQFGLAQIRDVSSSRHGFMATVCNYGDVRVETAGDTPNFLFKTCENPDVVAKQIMAAHKGAVAGENVAEK